MTHEKKSLSEIEVEREKEKVTEPDTQGRNRNKESSKLAPVTGFKWRGLSWWIGQFGRECENCRELEKKLKEAKEAGERQRRKLLILQEKVERNSWQILLLLVGLLLFFILSGFLAYKIIQLLINKKRWR